MEKEKEKIKGEEEKRRLADAGYGWKCVYEANEELTGVMKKKRMCNKGLPGDVILCFSLFPSPLPSCLRSTPTAYPSLPTAFR